MSATTKPLVLPRHPTARQALSTIRADLAREERELVAGVQRRRERIERLQQISARSRELNDHTLPDLLTVMVGLLEALSRQQAGLVVTVRQTAGWCALEPQPWPPRDPHAVWQEIDPGAPSASRAAEAVSPDEVETEDLGAWLALQSADERSSDVH